MEQANMVVSSIMGQGKVNQLGGRYINGRPLSTQKREAIIKLFQQGEKPCNISRRLQVSHGAVSKILNRFNETGSIQPGQIGGTARTRKTIVHFEKDIRAMLHSNPQIQPKDIRAALIKNGRCTKDNAPTEASIGRRLTMFKRSISENATRKKNAKANRSPANPNPNPPPAEQPSPPLPYSIDGILGSSSANQANISSTVPTSSNTSTSNDDTWTDEDDATSDNRCENRRNRTAFTAEQIKTLEKRFEENMYPTEDDKKDIIGATGLDLNRVNTWFSNRRARVRKSCGYGIADVPAAVNPTPPQVPPAIWLPQATSGFPMLPGSMGSPPLPFVMPNLPLPFLNQLFMMSKSFDAGHHMGFPGLNAT